jgi:hypothetical protein
VSPTSRFAALCVAGTMACAAAAPPSSAQTSQGGAAPPAGSNLLNPNTSVIGWFQGEAGDRTKLAGTRAFELKEAEIGLQAAVDPYSRADFFMSVNSEGIELEEGYLTLLSLPAGLSAKLGKFRENFGKFNRTHPPETPFADRPLAAERFLGEEGLSTAGASVSWLVPNPLGVYLNFDAEVGTTPGAGESPAFSAYRGSDLLYVGRLGSFVDLNESCNLAFGGSYANGANGSVQADTTLEALRSQLYGADVTFRWKNPRRAIYRSLIIQAEVMERSAEPLVGPPSVNRGAFAYADYQFARRWHLGARYDWSEALDRWRAHATGGLGFLTFTPSEFALVSLQTSHHELEDGLSETRWFLKTTFNIGPHGAHPF